MSRALPVTSCAESLRIHAAHEAHANDPDTWLRHVEILHQSDQCRWKRFVTLAKDFRRYEAEIGKARTLHRDRRCPENGVCVKQEW